MVKKHMLGAAALLALAFAPAASAAITAEALAEAALARTQHAVTYDGSYRRIAYPLGDVPAHLGVCSDVVIRAYRALGIDLQARVHEDMAADFSAYPAHWGLSKPDPNIDHRRVPNLRAYFARHGESLPVSRKASDYRPGDIVTWNLKGAVGGNLPHIGIVTGKRAADTGNPLIVHNIGRGPRLDDMVLAYPITGHYRYLPGD